MVKIEDTYSIHIPKPETELERQIAKRLKWNKYFFQFPQVTKYTVKKIKRLNLDKEDIEYIPSTLRVVNNSTKKHTAWIYLPDKTNHNELHVRFAEYCRHLNLPLDFKKQFPFLWSILQDQYLVNIVNARNLKRMRLKLKGLVKLNIDYTTIIFYQHYLIRQFPEYQTYCYNDRFFYNFMEDVSAILKLVYTRGMKEETFNELIDKTIDILKHIKVKKNQQL